MRKFLILLCLIPLFLLSCNRSGMGIFYSISEEQPLTDTDLDNALSVSGMVKAGTDYFMSAGTLFRRTADGGIWDDTVAMPVDMDVCVALALFEFDGNLYGLFADTAGNTTGLYVSAPGTINWTQVVSVSDKRLTALTATSTALYVTEMVDIATYVTRESQNGKDFITLALDRQYTSVTDAAIFLGETWLLSGANIYSGSVGVPASYIKLVGTPTTTFGYGGIFASNSSSWVVPVLFVSSAEGVVFATSDGATWISAAIVDTDENPVPLNDMAEIDIAGTPVILVGAKNGYYDIIFEGGALTSTFTPVMPGSEDSGLYSSSDSNYLKIDLRSSVVRFFFIDDDDAANATIFACTSGNGLWVNPISGDDPSSLVRKWDRQ